MSDAPDNDPTIKRSAPGLDGGSAPSGPLETEGDDGKALPIGTLRGEFEIRSVIGEGGFSIVYEAWDHSLLRSVALKEYIPAELAMRDSSMRVTARSRRHRETFEVGLKSFVSEARLLASFDHHSLVKVHRFWEEHGTAYMVMPWYRGPTLKQELTNGHAAVNEAWLLKLLDPLTEALAVLHAQKCYHRDIAPDNIILVGAAKAPLLLDFGAARQIIGSMTQDLTAILKRGYAPIEQYGEIRDMHQGPWTDIYALAAVVHFAIRGSTPPPAVARLVKDMYQPLARAGLKGYSDQFLKVIDQCLSVRPEHRIGSMADFRLRVGLDRAPNDVSPRAPIERRRPAPAGGTPVERPQAAIASRVPPRALRSALAVAALATVCIGGFAWHALQHRASDATGASAASADAPTATPASDTVLLPASAPAIAVKAESKPSPDTPLAAPAAPVAPAAEDHPAARDLQAVKETDAMFSDLQSLARTEKRDVTSALNRILDIQAEAKTESRAGNFQQALALDLDGRRLTAETLNAMVTDLVASYGKVAEQATAAGRPDIAQKALSRAKKVGALKRPEAPATALNRLQ